MIGITFVEFLNYLKSFLVNIVLVVELILLSKWFRFIYVDGVLNINSDYGYAVFNWYNPNNHILAYTNFKNIGYIMEKAVGYKYEDVHGFNQDLFIKEFEEFVQERKEEGYICRGEDIETPYCEEQEDVINHFKHCGDIYGDDLYESGCLTLGTYLNIRPYIWWHSLNTALEILDKKGVFNMEIMTRKEARKLIDKHSREDEFGVEVVSKKVAYIIADYLPKDKDAK